MKIPDDLFSFLTLITSRKMYFIYAWEIKTNQNQNAGNLNIYVCSYVLSQFLQNKSDFFF